MLELLLGRRLEVVGLEAGDGGVGHPQRLLHALLERAADRHHLADRLHRRADLARDALELGQVPARHLDDDVVERRLEARGGRLGDRVGQVRQQLAQRELGGDEGERVARRLGGERRGAREARVHLDNAVVLRVGVERVLDVALADDAQVADHLDGGRAEHVVLLVGERLRRRDDDRVARVDAERVEVLHVAHSDAVVGRVANDLVLDLLPALHRTLDQDLRRARECLLGELAARDLVVGEARPEAAERKRSAHDHRVSDLGGGFDGLLDRCGGVANRDLLVDLTQLLHENVAILRRLDRRHRRAQDAHIVLVEDALLLQRDSAVERGLTAKLEQDAVGALLGDDLLDDVGVDGQEVDAVRHACGGLDGGDVGVDEDGPASHLFQGLDRLRA
mmetsp:Transcript_12244/g.26463  ORF Transcript_12244/g.26463 Transcript_12244/m.26463 type:complete len:392 (+) Transcript_12244:464-1639(+)